MAAAMSATVHVTFDDPSEAPLGIPANGTANFIKSKRFVCTRAAPPPGSDDDDDTNRYMCFCDWINVTELVYIAPTPAPSPVAVPVPVPARVH